MLGAVALALIGRVENFWAVIGLIVVWGLLFAAAMPIRQTYLNGLIPSRQRATILSFDSLMGSAGGVWAQPVLGRAADVWGYAPSYLLGAGISALALPFLACRAAQNAPADTIEDIEPAVEIDPIPSEATASAPQAGGSGWALRAEGDLEEDMTLAVPRPSCLRVELHSRRVALVGETVDQGAAELAGQSLELGHQREARTRPAQVLDHPDLIQEQLGSRLVRMAGPSMRRCEPRRLAVHGCDDQVAAVVARKARVAWASIGSSNASAKRKHLVLVTGSELVRRRPAVRSSGEEGLELRGEDRGVDVVLFDLPAAMRGVGQRRGDRLRGLVHPRNGPPARTRVGIVTEACARPGASSRP